MLNAAHKALAYHAAHAATHKAKLKASGYQADAAHVAAHNYQRICLARVIKRFFQALGVFAAVFELERINGQHLLRKLITALGI